MNSSTAPSCRVSFMLHFIGTVLPRNRGRKPDMLSRTSGPLADDRISSGRGASCGQRLRRATPEAFLRRKKSGREKPNKSARCIATESLCLSQLQSWMLCMGS